MTPTSPEEDLDALYSCPPGEFLERRKALAQALRKAGQRDDATAVAALAKPTPAAWAVNQLARTNPEEMAALSQVGEQLRAEVRASFTGRTDAAATARARTAQREVVARLTQLASRLLEEVGAPRSPAVLERVAATLTTISTTGAWGDSAPRRLAHELDPPGIEALAALVSDMTSPPAPAEVRARGPAPAPAEARTERAPKDAAASKADGESARRAAEETARKAAEEAARKAAEEQRARIAAAEAALEAAASNEERARSALEGARVAAAAATSARAERDAAAREARRLATERQEAAEAARRAAETATLAAQESEQEAAGAASAERAAKSDLAEAEKALARTSAEYTLAEETLVRERRGRARQSV